MTIELTTCTITLNEQQHELKPKVKAEIMSFLRVNPRFNGYVFVPDTEHPGRVKTGAYIEHYELGNRRLISTPAMVLFFDKATDKFYSVVRTEKIAEKAVKPVVEPEAERVAS